MLKELNIKARLKQIGALEDVNQDLVVNLLKRIILLEDINGQLTADLKSCIGLLRQFENAVPDPEQLQDLLKPLESNLEAAGTVQEQKMFNLSCGFIGTP